MSSDSYYTIGAEHRVCQDFAIHSGGVAVLADGCSGEPNTDEGARLLARAALRSSPEEAVESASAVARRLGLETRSLAATLAKLTLEGGHLHAALYGDGVVVFRKKTGEVEVHTVTVDTSMPPYLMYNLSPGLLTGYAKTGSVVSIELPDGESSAEPADPRCPTLDLWRSTEEYDLALAMSDGALSFECEGSPIPLASIVEEVIAFKVMTSGFLQRRMMKFEKACAKRGWTHYDDFSAVALYAEAPCE